MENELDRNALEQEVLELELTRVKLRQAIMHNRHRMELDVFNELFKLEREADLQLEKIRQRLGLAATEEEKQKWLKSG